MGLITFVIKTTVLFLAIGHVLSLAFTRFNYTGSESQFSVPSYISSITVTACGASGGGGGLGGCITCPIVVTPSETLYVFVGQSGDNVCVSTSGACGGGYNGGGTAYYGGGSEAGGGASDVRRGGNTLNDRVVVAGGGGGGNGNLPYTSSSDGGTSTGHTGGCFLTCSATCVQSQGGSLSAGGTLGYCSGADIATDGSLGQGGNAGKVYAGGGGGGGYYGGGGGSGAWGGGGSSYCSSTASSNTQGVNNGNGYVLLQYSEAPTIAPTRVPSVSPTIAPSLLPTILPSALPTVVPTVAPTVLPTVVPSVTPTVNPTLTPSIGPTLVPSIVPSLSPTIIPSVLPTVLPSVNPTLNPSDARTLQPTVTPTTSSPSLYPTSPTSTPTLSDSADGSTTSVGVIVGAAVGGGVGLLLIVAGAYFFYFRPYVLPKMVKPTTVVPVQQTQPVAAAALTAAEGGGGGAGDVESLEVANLTLIRDPTKKYDLFLTHDWGVDEKKRDNHARVVKICGMLEKLGLRCWLDKKQITENVIKQMCDGIDASQYVVVFVTQRYMEKVNGENAKDNCQIEFNHAFQRYGTAGFVPVVMEDRMKRQAYVSTFGGGLGSLFRIDMVEDDKLEEACKELYNVVVTKSQKLRNQKWVG